MVSHTGNSNFNEIERKIDIKVQNGEPLSTKDINDLEELNSNGNDERQMIALMDSAIKAGNGVAVEQMEKIGIPVVHIYNGIYDTMKGRGSYDTSADNIDFSKIKDNRTLKTLSQAMKTKLENVRKEEEEIKKAIEKGEKENKEKGRKNNNNLNIYYYELMQLLATAEKLEHLISECENQIGQNNLASVEEKLNEQKKLNEQRQQNNKKTVVNTKETNEPSLSTTKVETSAPKQKANTSKEANNTKEADKPSLSTTKVETSAPKQKANTSKEVANQNKPKLQERCQSLNEKTENLNLARDQVEEKIQNTITNPPNPTRQKFDPINWRNYKGTLRNCHIKAIAKSGAIKTEEDLEELKNRISNQKDELGDKKNKTKEWNKNRVKFAQKVCVVKQEQQQEQDHHQTKLNNKRKTVNNTSMYLTH